MSFLCRPSIVIFMDGKMKIAKRSKKVHFKWNEVNGIVQVNCTSTNISSTFLHNSFPLCYFKYLKWQSTQIKFLVPILYCTINGLRTALIKWGVGHLAESNS